MTKRKETRVGRFARHTLTGADNQTWDIGRVLWALAFLIAILLTAHGHILGRPFDIQGFGIGLSSILAAGGLALRIKENTEPAGTNKPEPPHEDHVEPGKDNKELKC